MLLRLLSRVTLLLIDLPGDPPRYGRPDSATRPRYSEWLENNSHIIYPVIAVSVVALIAFGIISAWRNEDGDGLRKAELKREVIRQLRRDVYGNTADHLARQLGVSGGRMLALLEEMAEGNMVESHTDTARITTWRIKGLT